MADLIDRQAVLALPRNITRNMRGKIVEESIDVEMIKALPPAYVPDMNVGDMIYRQAAVDAVHEDADWLAAHGSDWQVERMERDKSILKSLPPAQPNTGYWGDYLPDGLRWKCSECGSRFETPYNFCPHCGARMER